MERIMSEQQNIDLVKQCYDLFRKGDIQQLLGCFADDIDWELPAVENVPFSGKRHGLDQVGEFFKSVSDSMDVRQFEPRDFIAQGDKVVAVGHYAWTVKSTGIPFESDFTHIFTIRGGKVTNLREFLDSHIAAAAFQPQQAGAMRGQAADAGRPPVH